MPRIIASLGLIIGVAITLSSQAFAVNYGGGSVQGYAAEAPLDNGTIVQLEGTGSNRVKVATQAQLQNMFGVTVDRTQLLLVSSNPALSNEVFVAVSGTYNLLVSTQGGPIAVGDYLTISSINGVAMKASTAQTTVFGRAAAAFDGKGVTLGTSPLKDSTGNTSQTVTLGLIPVAINIQHNPNVISTKQDLPDFLQRLGQQIAEKQVDPIRIYLSMAITAASIITAIVMLYAGVRNSLISIGRNPMSRKSVFRALLEVILTSILILTIGLSAVYLLLKL